jgi:hypothetical protein
MVFALSQKYQKIKQVSMLAEGKFIGTGRESDLFRLGESRGFCKCSNVVLSRCLELCSLFYLGIFFFPVCRLYARYGGQVGRLGWRGARAKQYKEW